jgi:hypothetical protein
LPTELSDEAAAQLIDFLYELAEALERHYAGQLIRRDHEQHPVAQPSEPELPLRDPPF